MVVVIYALHKPTTMLLGVAILIIWRTASSPTRAFHTATLVTKLARRAMLLILLGKMKEFIAELNNWNYY